jgi:biopolymer transport protein ExbD
MRLRTPPLTRRARIEIIPLIDVMFFLLASFMMVSLSLQRLRTMRMDLPAVSRAMGAGKVPRMEVRIDRAGDVFVGEARVTLPDFMVLVREKVGRDTNLPVVIRADALATHGDVLRVMDSARHAGAIAVWFQLDSPRVPGN